MSLIWLIFTILVGVTHHAVGNEELEQATPQLMTGFEKLAEQQPHFEIDSGGFVCGVSIVSGNYFTSTIDARTNGVDPLQVDRCYFARPPSKEYVQVCDGPNVYGWYLNYNYLLMMDEYRGAIAALAEPCGGMVAYSRDENQRQQYFFDLEKHGKGVTNSSCGVLSGQNNVKNKRIYYTGSRYHMSFGNGSARVYKKTPKSEISSSQFLYYLKKERKPSGNIVHYKYNSYGELNKIKTTNPDGSKTLNELKFQYPPKSKYLNIITSDGRKTQFRSKKFKHKNGTKQEILKKVIRPDGHTILYHYVEPSSKKGGYFVGTDLPEGRKFRIEYEQGRNPKVHALKSALGADDGFIKTHQFHYETDYTDVIDALGSQVRYYYNSEHRVTAIHRYNAGEVESIEKNYWGEEKQQTYLVAKSLEDSEGTIYLFRQFVYDERGNVLEEAIYGNLSGTCTLEIVLDEDGHVIENGVESYKKSYTYSNDGFNLLLSETDGIGRTHYFYKQGTNLLIKKLVSDPEKQHLRSFREYDESACLIKLIEDDGSGDAIDDLTDCTERHITISQVREEGPGIGLPEVIETKYYDFEQNQEILIKRVINHYSEHNEVIQQDIYDAEGNFAYTISQDYNAMGQVIRKSDPGGHQTHYTYNAHGEIVHQIGPGGDVEQLFVYDTLGHLIKKMSRSLEAEETTRYRYDLVGNLVSEIDPLGNETHHIYDDLSREIQTIYPPSINSQGESQVIDRIKKYDIAGNVVYLRDERGDVTETAYNIRGQPTRMQVKSSDLVLNEELFEYDMRGNLIKKVDKTGLITTWTYDFLDRIICTDIGDGFSVEKTVYNAFHPVKKIDPEGAVSEFIYDGFGRVKTKTYAETSKTSYEYDSLGRVASQKDWYGKDENDYTAKRYIYDLLDRILENCSEDAHGTIYEKISYDYDIRGNCTHESHYPQGQDPQVTMTIYDGFNRPLIVIDPLGNKYCSSYGSIFLPSRGIYGRFTKQVDPLGTITEIVHDGSNRVLKVTKKNVAGQQIQYQQLYYDEIGNKTSVIHTVYKEDGTTKTVTHRFTYGPLNLLLEEQEEGELKDGYVFNASAQMVEKHTAENTTYFQYDLLGRVSHTQAPSIDYSYHYNLNNQITQVTRTDDRGQQFETKRYYDRAGRMVKERQESGFAVLSTFDRQGRALSLRLPDDSSIFYHYEGPFLKKITRYDSHDRFQYHHRYLKRTLEGKVTSSQMICSSGKLTRSYDPKGRIQEIFSQQWSEVIPPDGYDAVGNLTQMSAHDLVGSRTQSFRYNALSQLIEETGASSHQYSYDSLHNRLQRDDQTYQIGKRNRLLNDGHSTYQWSAEGNLCVISGEINTQCSYDAFSHLLRYNDTQYTYDPFDRRLSKQQGDAPIVYYLYDGDHEIATLDQAGKILELRVLGEGLGADFGAAIAIEKEDRVYAPIHDARGSVRCLLDARTGETVECYRFSAYGEEKIYNQTGEQIDPRFATSSWRYCSKRTDPESGWVFFGRRYYAPHIGRWTTADPLGFSEGANLFAYVNNNPLTLYDLYGLSTRDDRVRPLTESRNCLEFFTMMGKKAFGAVEWIGKNMIPMPGVRDVIETTGRWGGGGKLLQYSEYISSCSQVVYIPGKKISGVINAYMNGMRTTLEESIEVAKQIAASRGGVEMYLLYNGTNGLMTDCLESILLKTGLCMAPETLIQNFVSNTLTQDPNTEIHLSGHSQAGLHIYNAAQNLSEKQRSQMHVITYGSAKIIPKTLFGHVDNFISERDFIPMTDVIGYATARMGFSSHVHFLSPSSINPLREHMIMEKTYQAAIRSVGKEFIHRYSDKL